ncbi:MAG: hypothetical protein A3I01_01245 [Betaproteobacteria bacterium RIFCSPLOWO2_02_FULL_65_24]|nr:MAG: hypothetical protein A3I01_01245 [Betaproteobacteria bacterium RIFCSPLOWO2_02_FULL_65_24]
MRRILLMMLCLFAPGALLAQVKGETGGVYVAGEGFSFEQAAADALRERASSPADPLAVLVLGGEVRRVTLKGTTPELRSLADKLQAAGATLYVCERDIRAARLNPAEFLPGVRIERGWTRAEAQANVGSRKEADSRAPEAMLRRIRRLCAES